MEHHSKLGARQFRQNLPATLAIAGTLILITSITSCEAPPKHAVLTMQPGTIAGQQPVPSRPAINKPSKRDPIFGDYDRKLIQAVEKRWFALLDQRNYQGEAKGLVTVKFRLNADGSVSNMRVTKNDVSAALAAVCQSAINDNAPFEQWSERMRKRVVY